MTRIEIIGKKYHKATVIKYVGKWGSYTSAWECMCDCGKVFITSSYGLRSGRTKSCGCYRYEYNSIVGKEHPWARILRKVKRQVKGTASLYECECKICNKICLKNSSKLINPKYKSCGCIKPIYKPGQAASYDVYKSYERSAKLRKLDFKLTYEQFLLMTQGNCYYCGQKPSNKAKISNNGEYEYNGLDRVDNLKGYNLCNLVSCCKICNKMKSDLSINEFLELVTKIYRNISYGRKTNLGKTQSEEKVDAVNSIAES